jgi:hypothetical protein
MTYKTYKIIRFFRDHPKYNCVAGRGLSLKAAQAWCKDPEASSSTCTSPARRKLTAIRGPWFEGYTEDEET